MRCWGFKLLVSLVYRVGTTGWGGLRTLLLAMMLKTMLKTLPIFHQKDF